MVLTKDLKISQKIIPLSKSEAWKLYSQGKDIVEMKSLNSQMFFVDKGHDYSKFHESEQLFALCLSKEESKEIEKPSNWRFLKVIVAMYSLCAGLSLFYFWYSGFSSLKFSSTEILIYSQVCFAIGSYFVVSILDSIKLEKKILDNIYEKYKISDWESLNNL